MQKIVYIKNPHSLQDVNDNNQTDCQYFKIRASLCVEMFSKGAGPA
jgi:hypothetical protein